MNDRDRFYREYMGTFPVRASEHLTAAEAHEEVDAIMRRGNTATRVHLFERALLRFREQSSEEWVRQLADEVLRGLHQDPEPYPKIWEMP